MWLSKIKNKKAQYSLLGVIFTIAITLISVSLIVTVVSGTFAKEYYKGDSTPDIHIITTNKSVIEKTESFYKEQGDKVWNYKEYDIYSVSTNLSFEEYVNEGLMSYVIPIDNVDNLSNKINIIEGNPEEKSPKKGEIWVPSTVANLRELEIGNRIEIIDSKGKTLEYEISAIINDSNQSSTAIGTLYLYVNEEDRESLKSLPLVKMVTMNCDGNSGEKARGLVEYINEPIGGAILDKGLYIMASTVTASIIGGLGLMASLVLIIILIIILRGNIRNNILKEYKSIGTYKALGYSSKKIIGVYLKGYGLVSIISSILGILTSIPMATYISNIVFRNLGEYSFDRSSLVIVIVIFILFNLLVYINLYMVLRSVNNIKPVDAINIGLTSSKKKMKKSIIKNSSSSFAMAINDIFKYKKSNIVIFIMFIVVFYMSSLFINVASTMNNLDEDLYKIFGIPKSDFVISAEGDIEDSAKGVNEYLKGDNRVEKVYRWNVMGQRKVSLDNKKYKVDGGVSFVAVYSEFNEEDFSILKGINPRNEKEVSFSTDLMNKNNFKIGDYISLNVEGAGREFLIVGEYASTMGNGQSLRLTSDALSTGKEGNVDFVKLKDLKDYEGLKKDIENKFSNLKVDKLYAPLKDSSSQVVDTAVPISTVLLVGVILFGVINIMNMLMISNLDNRKNYGIMKGLGFPSKYIRERSNYRIMMLAFLGGIVGVSLTYFTSSKLMQLTTGFYIFTFDFKLTTIIVGIIFGLTILTMNLCNKGIKKISTVELIRE